MGTEGKTPVDLDQLMRLLDEAADSLANSQVRKLLAVRGVYVVSAAEKAVLDWAARLSVGELGLLRGDEYDQSEASIGFAQSELRRRQGRP